MYATIMTLLLSYGRKYQHILFFTDIWPNILLKTTTANSSWATLGRLYGVRHMVKDHSDSERGNLLRPHWLLFPISSKGSFICIIPQTG